MFVESPIPPGKIKQKRKVMKFWRTLYKNLERLYDENKLPYGIEQIGGLRIYQLGDGGLLVQSCSYGNEHDFNPHLLQAFFAQCIKNGWIEGPVTVVGKTNDSSTAFRVFTNGELETFAFATAPADHSLSLQDFNYILGAPFPPSH